MKKRLSPVYTLRGFRRSLASIDALPQFAILGIFSGLVTGLVILAFRTAIELPLSLLLPDGDFENFEGLSTLSHLMLPALGALSIGIAFSLLKSDRQQVGVSHVLQRLSRHQGYLPTGNLLVQFVGGTLALLTGQSSDREGPAVHLGAASSSLLGQALKLPNNSIRILVGCGAAAAISASFNTPLAGVIFSMEVVVMEYSIAGFVPVILAAISATLVNQVVYGRLAAFDIPALSMRTFFDIPYVVLEGFLIGALAAAFIACVRFFHRYAPTQAWQRLTLAGLITGLMAMGVPEILGIGYDTVNHALVGELSFLILIAACLCKLVASAASVGMGMPAGLIGPTLFIGATAGGQLGIIGNSILPDYASSHGFYVMLGMGAMMGAVLQAPLAALLAIVELTHNPNIVLPAMLAIVVANLTSSQIFGCRSIFLTQMDLLGLEFRHNPLSLALNRASVASIMERNMDRLQRIIPHAAARAALADKPHWILVDDDDGPAFIVRAEDLANHLDSLEDDTAEIDLASFAATRKDVTGVLLQATLQEALDILDKSGVEALYVTRISAPMIDSVAGIVTREDIEAYYQS